MASLPDPSKVPIGKAVGWRLEIANGVVIDHSHAWADISVSLDSNISAGAVDLALRGVSDDQFTAIAQAWQPRQTVSGERTATRALVTGKLKLFWRDQVGSQPDDSQAPVLIEFALTSLSRRSEGMQFVTRIEGKHSLFERLERAVTGDDSAAKVKGPIEAAAAVLAAASFKAGTDYEQTTPWPGTSPSPEETFDVQPKSPVLSQLEELGDAMLKRYGLRGCGAYLLRGGKLYVGPFWPVPWAGRIVELSPETGFIAAQMQGHELPLSGTEALSTSSPAPLARENWRVQCVGRADLGPGDVVSFMVPSADAALFGGVGLAAIPDDWNLQPQPVTLYVTSVHHASSRDSGWTSELVGISVPDPDALPSSAWTQINASSHAVPSTGEDLPRADHAGTVRARVGAIAAEEIAARPQNDIAEVRSFTAATAMAGDNVESAAQSSSLIVGADNRTGAGAARHADLVRDGAVRQASNTPYLTPFAWGPFGQVLPRYPGTRVMVSYHHNSRHDAVDMGALWRTSDDGAARAPGNTQPGDWWLILPAGVEFASGEGAAAIDPPEDAKASHDLIDASGERRIAVNGFTIRAYGADSLPGPADRPEQPDGDHEAGGIHIEHVDSGALISITTDGKITIKATGELTLEGDGIKLKPGSGTVDVG